ncbi:MAG: DUF1775 domain-containing protein [Albidovulum sp.]
MKPTRILAAALMLCVNSWASSALAHASFVTPTTPAGATFKADLRIPHGCDGQATLDVHIRIPEGFFSVKPMPKAGWTLKTSQSDYAKTYMNHGKPVSAGVTEIRWSGNLPDNWFDEFSFRGTVDPDMDPGSTLYFIVTQTCADGRVVWSEIPSDDAPGQKLERPAVALTVSKAEGHTH